VRTPQNDLIKIEISKTEHKIPFVGTNWTPFPFPTMTIRKNVRKKTSIKKLFTKNTHMPEKEKKPPQRKLISANNYYCTAVVHFAQKKKIYTTKE